MGISSFSGFRLCLCMHLYYFLIDLGRNCGLPRVNFGAAGATRDHFGGILCSGDFPRTTKLIQIYLCSASSDNVRRNSRDLNRNRCPVISQPSVHSETTFCLIGFVHGWGLAGVILNCKRGAWKLFCLHVKTCCDHTQFAEFSGPRSLAHQGVHSWLLSGTQFVG